MSYSSDTLVESFSEDTLIESSSEDTLIESSNSEDILSESSSLEVTTNVIKKKKLIKKKSTKKKVVKKKVKTNIYYKIEFPQPVCYIIKSINTPYVYIGYTIDFSRRIRQHNRELKGGAKKTGKYYPF